MLRFFDDAGKLVSENQCYTDPKSGRAAIMIVMRFANGRKVRELYSGRVLVDGQLVGGRIINRATYEQQRLEYPDMPEADTSVLDESAEHLEKMEREQRERDAAATRLGLDPSQLTKSDLFCAKLMEKGRRANAVEWIQSEGHTLGEMDHSESRRLVTKLMDLGAVAIHACEIDSYSEGEENTGHLVVELPSPSRARKALRKALNRLAREQGYEGDPDKGQRYSYVKLD
jgi:hypothetical protein